MIAAARLLDSYYRVQVLITGDGLTSLEIGLNPCSINPSEVLAHTLHCFIWAELENTSSL